MHLDSGRLLAGDTSRFRETSSGCYSYIQTCFQRAIHLSSRTFLAYDIGRIKDVLAGDSSKA
jgi:hypothetical protein